MGAPSSAQKALGSPGAVAEQSFQCPRLVPAGDSGLGRQESSPRDQSPLSPLTSLRAEDILGKLLPPVTSWYRLSRDTSFSFS